MCCKIKVLPNIPEEEYLWLISHILKKYISRMPWKLQQYIVLKLKLRENEDRIFCDQEWMDPESKEETPGMELEVRKWEWEEGETQM